MQKTFCTNVMLGFLVATSAVQINAECELLTALRTAGAEQFTVHGVARDWFLKAALEDFVKAQLPNSPFFSLGHQDFELHDLFIVLSDSLADVLDAQLMGGSVDNIEALRNAFAGRFAHKLWIALLDVAGISNRVSDDVKESYNRYAKAWVTKAFAVSINKTIDRLTARN